MRSVLTVVGARPQFIKAAVVSRELRAAAAFTEILVHTGQHYDDNMSDVFFAELDIPSPKFHLGIGSAGHGAQTGRMLSELERVLLETKPAVVVVYGDTNSTLAGALAASKLNIPVAHVEAGLRSYNRRMPEEINRVVADHLASVLFAPSDASMRNLLTEGIAADAIVRTGDVMYDVALEAASRAAGRTEVYTRLGVTSGAFVLATVHRAENTDDPATLRAILDALRCLAIEVPVILPLHPRTRAKLHDVGSEELVTSEGLHIIEPVGYLDMVALEIGARLIVTDSGGVQKEAYFHRVPCVTMRSETEWVELIEVGWNRLAPPTTASAIVMAAQAAMSQAPAGHPELYGDGKTARHIVDELQRRF